MSSITYQIHQGFRRKSKLIAGLSIGVALMILIGMFLRLQQVTLAAGQFEDDWGVVVLNTDQDVYRPGETVFIALAVLDDEGKPICNTSPELTINDQVVEVDQRDNCQNFDSSSIADDYTASYTLSGPGIHAVELMVDNGNGERLITDTIVVEEDPAIVVSRSAATRLYPVSQTGSPDSPMNITVEFADDFAGTLTEAVPASFEIAGISGGGVLASGAESQTITWDVSVTAGESVYLSYKYDAPDTSPDLFAIEGLQASSPDGELTENRQWRIANDNVISEVSPNDNEIVQFGIDGDSINGREQLEIAYSDTSEVYLAVFSAVDGSNGYYGQIVNKDGTPSGSRFLIDGSVGIQTNVAQKIAVDWNPDTNEFLAAWWTTSFPTTQIKTRRIDTSGTLLGSENVIDSESSPQVIYFGDVVYNDTNNEYLLVGNYFNGTDSNFLSYELSGTTGALSSGPNSLLTGITGNANHLKGADVVWNSVDNEYAFTDFDAWSSSYMRLHRLNSAGTSVLTTITPYSGAGSNNTAPSLAYSPIENRYFLSFASESSLALQRAVYSNTLGTVLAPSTYHTDGDNSFYANGGFYGSGRAVYLSTLNQFAAVYLDAVTGTNSYTDQEVEIQLFDTSGGLLGTNNLKITDIGDDGGPDVNAGAIAVAIPQQAGIETMVVYMADDSDNSDINSDYDLYSQRVTQACVWTNGNATGVWNDALNWDSCSGNVPGVGAGAGSIALFNSTSTDNSTIDVVITDLGGLIVESAYTGTIDNSPNDHAVTLDLAVLDGTGTLNMGDGIWTINGNFDGADQGAINGNAGTLTFAADGNLATGANSLNNLTINTGVTVSGNAATIRVGGNWNAVGTGTFSPGTSSVILNGTGDQDVFGANSFYNLSSTGGPKTLGFVEDLQTSIITGGSLSLTGTSGNNLLLRTIDVGGTVLNDSSQHTIDVADGAGVVSANFIDIRDHRLEDTATPITSVIIEDPTDRINSGNVVGWFAPTCVWDGGHASINNWSEATNWVGDVVPTTDCVVTISDGATSDDVIIDVPVTIAGLTILSSYSGHIDNATNDQTVQISGSLTADGSGALSMGDATWAVIGNIDIADQTTVNANSSTLISAASTGTVDVGTHALNNFELGALGPLLWYKFDNNVTNFGTLTVSTPLVTGSPTFETTIPSTSFSNSHSRKSPTGTSEIIANFPTDISSGDFSVSVWTYRDPVETSNVVPFALSSPVNGQSFSHWAHPSAQNIYVAGNPVSAPSATVVASTWAHYVYAFEYATDTFRTYKDGTLVSTISSGGGQDLGICALALSGYSDTLCLGSSGTVPNWNDDFRLYDRLLDSAEITDLAAGNIGPAVAGSAGNVTLLSDITANGNVSIDAGTLIANGNNINVGGNWTNNVGNAGFTGGTAAVSFTGVGPHAINGDTTFNNVTFQDQIDDNADTIYTFEAGSTTTIDGTATFDGTDAADRLVMVSSTPTSTYTIDFKGIKGIIDWLDVTDSTATSTNTAISLPVTPIADNVEQTNVTNWFFTPGPGGVSNNLRMWLKANDGPDSPSDGSEVTTWTDQSGNTNNGTQVSSSLRPTYEDDAASLINNNPVVRFDGSDDYLDLPNSTIPTGSDPVAVYMSGENFSSTGSIDYVISAGDDSPAEEFFSASISLLPERASSVVGSEVLISGTSFSTGDPFLYGMSIDKAVTGSDNFFVLQNGGVVNSVEHTTTKSTAANDHALGVLRHNLGLGVYYAGYLGDVIVYSSVPTELEESQINTYLALKYGVSLSSDNDGDTTAGEVISGAVTEGDYVFSDGSTVLWDYSVNSTYHNDVAGIAQDDASVLTQSNSRSVSDDSIVNVHTPSTLGDGDALVWGNNDGAATFSVVGAPTNRHILDRVWKADVTGTPGTVTMDVSTTTPGFNIPDASIYYLLVDSDGDFSTGAVETTMTDQGSNVWRAATQTIADGSFFTIASVPGIQGTVYTDEGITNIGAGKTVRLLVNGVDSGLTDDTDASGIYEIPLATYSAGDVLTVYLDDETENGVTVTLGATNDGNVSGLDIYQNYLRATHESAGPLTDGNLATADDADPGTSSDDISSVYGASAASNGVVSTATSANELLIVSGKTLQLAGTASLDAAGTVDVDGTLDAGANLVSLAGDLDVDNAGTFTHASFMLLDGTAAQSFNQGDDPIGSDIVITNTSGVVSLDTNPLDIGANDLTISAGATLNLNGLNVTNATGSFHNTGTLQANGQETVINLTMDIDSGVFEFIDDGDNIAETIDISGSPFPSTYYWLRINNDDTTPAERDTFRVLTNPITINGTLDLISGTFDSNDIATDINVGVTIGADGVFDAGASAITVTGDWSNSGAFTAGTSTVTLDGAANDHSISGTTTFNNLTVTEDNDADDGVLTFQNGTTTTISGILTLDGVDADDRINLVSDSAGNQFTINTTSATYGATDFLDVMDSDLQESGVTKSPELDPADSLNSGNTNGWFSTTFISGTVYTDEGVTNIGAGKTVRLLVNGVDSGLTDDTDGSGVYTILLPIYNAGDVLTLYIDDETENGVTVSRAANNATINNLDIYQNYLRTTHEDAGPLTDANLATADNADPGSSTDDISAIYTVPVLNLLTPTTTELIVVSGTTLQLANTADIDGHVDVDGTLDAGANAVNLAGDLDVDNTGTFTHTGTLTLDGTTAQSYNQGDDAIGSDISVTNTSATVTVSTNALDIGANDLTINTGSTLNLNANSVTATGTFSNTGTLQFVGDELAVNLTQDTNSGAWELIDDGNNSAEIIDIDGTPFPSTYYDLIINSDDPQAAERDTLRVTTSALTVNNDLTVTAGTFNTNDQTLSVGNNLQVDDIFLGGSASNDVNGNVTNSATGVMTATSGATTVAGNWSNSGTFTHSSGSVTFDPDVSHSLNGSTTFNDFTFQVTTDDNDGGHTLTVDNTATIGFQGSLTLDGLDANDELLIVSDSATNQADFRFDNTGASSSIGDFLNITDNNIDNTNGANISLPINPADSNDGGNTTNWFGSVIVEFSDLTASSTDESAANNYPTLYVNGSLASAETIDVDIAGGTATGSGTDYTQTDPLTVTIPAGTYDGTSATDIVFTAPTINNDSIVEGDETITYVFANPGTHVSVGDADGSTVAESTHTYTITDDDQLLVEFTNTTDSSAEATANPTFTISVSGADTSTTGPDTVDVDITGGTATGGGTDYTLADPVTVTIPAADYTTLQTITVGLVLNDDGILEGDETITMSLANPTGEATIGDADGAGGTENANTFTITDDETAVIDFTSATSSTVDEATTVTINTQIDLTATTGTPSIASGQTLTFDSTYNIGSSGATNATSNDIEYNLPGGVQSFTFGDTTTDLDTQSLTYTLNDDGLIEGVETAVFDLAFAGAGTLNAASQTSIGATNAHTLSITDDDGLSVAFSNAVDSAAEASGTPTYTIAVSGADSTGSGAESIDVQINAGGTATGGGTDYTYTSGTTINIPAADYTTPVTFPVGLVLDDDNLLEGDETINLELVNPSSGNLTIGTQNTNIFTITDDETATVEFSALTSNTGGDEDGAVTVSGELTLTSTTGTPAIATGQTITAEAAYNVVSTATNGASQDIDFTSPETLTWTDADATGATKNLTFTLTDDAIVEGDETGIFDMTLAGVGTLNSSSQVTLGGDVQHTLTIDDDDGLSIQFSSATDTAAEAAGTSALELEVVGGVSVVSQTVDIDVTGGTATSGGTDYTFTDPTIFTIPAGNYTSAAVLTQNITLDDDGLLEGDETIDLALINPSANIAVGTQSTSTFTITEDETASIEFTSVSGNTAGDEDGASTVTAQLTLTSTTGTPAIDTGDTITVDATYNGSSTATNSAGQDIDFTTPETLTFTDADASGAVRNLTYTLTDDSVVEGDETAVFELGNLGGSLPASIGANNSHTLTINDDDAVTVQFVNAADSSLEATGAVPQVVVSGAEITSAGSVDVTVTGGSATSGGADYNHTVSLTIPAADYTTPANLNINTTVVDDGIFEGDETVAYLLANSSNVVVGAQATNTYTITDDEAVSVQFSTSASNTSGDEDAAVTTVQAELTVTSTSGPGTLDAGETVRLNVADSTTGTASTPSEYTFTPLTIEFTSADASGATKSVGVLLVDDNFDEADETVILNMAANGTGTITPTLGANATHTLMINDDDTAGVAITPTSVNSTEAGAQGTYTIVLDSEPYNGGTDVVIDLSLGNGESTLSTPQVSFDSTNWSTPQTITVTAQDDALVEGNHTTVISHTINATGTTDTMYDALVGIASVTNNIADDDFAGVSLSKSSVNVTEGGATDTYNVQLTSQPQVTTTVRVTITPDGEVDLGSGAGVAINLDFDDSNWNVTQTATVTANNDIAIETNPHNGIISHAIDTGATTDTDYDTLVGIGDVTAIITDDDIDTDGDGDRDAIDDDDDGDGVIDVLEDLAPNDDGNGDGIVDRIQSAVASNANPVTGAHATLEISGCVVINGFSVVDEASLARLDPDADYPVGLNDFQLQCINPGDTAIVTLLYDQVYDTSDWSYKKYDDVGNVFSDLTSSVSFGTRDVNGTDVTTVTYTVTDGGSYDTDGTANAVIDDPAGPAVLATTTSETGLSETGVAAIAVVAAGALILTTTLQVARISRRNRR